MLLFCDSVGYKFKQKVENENLFSTKDILIRYYGTGITIQCRKIYVRNTSTIERTVRLICDWMRVLP